MTGERSKDKNRKDDLNRGEGNKAADRRYRDGVKETVEDIPEEERARRARSLSGTEKEEARRAEDEGRSHAR